MEQHPGDDELSIDPGIDPESTFRLSVLHMGHQSWANSCDSWRKETSSNVIYIVNRKRRFKNNFRVRLTALGWVTVIEWRGRVLYYFVLYCIVLYCIVLYCVVRGKSTDLMRLCARKSVIINLIMTWNRIKWKEINCIEKSLALYDIT